MPEASPRTRRRLAPVFALLIVLPLAAAALGAWLIHQSVALDRETAAALANALTAPRTVFDGRTLDVRYDWALQDIAAAQQRTAAEVRRALERFASGGILGTKRSGYDAFLAQLATKRFEIAIASMRELATAAKSTAKPEIAAWQLLSLTATLEFGRGRAVVADPLAAQAFDLANKRDELDTPAAAGLLATLGAIRLSQSQASEAEPYLRRAASILKKDAGADLRDRARALILYGQSIAAQGFPEEAEPLCAEALGLAAQFRKTQGRPDTDQPILEETYRKLLREQGLAEAEITERTQALIRAE